MKPFPELFELVDFFECEPILYDPEGDWYYNHLTFKTIRNNERIECELEPADSVLNFRWFQEEREVLNVRLQTVRELRIETRGGNEILRATLFSESPDIGPLLIIQIKPSVHIYLEMKENY